MTLPVSREGKKKLHTWLTLGTWKTLHHLATETDRSTEKVLEEAITSLAKKHGLEPGRPSKNAKKPTVRATAARVALTHR